MLQAHIAIKKNPAQLLARLTEVERSMIRAANDDRLEYLRQTSHASDGISEADMKIVRDTLLKEFVDHSASKTFGRTWAF